VPLFKVHYCAQLDASMKRREFIAGLSTAVVMPSLTHAQEHRVGAFFPFEMTEQLRIAINQGHGKGTLLIPLQLRERTTKRACLLSRQPRSVRQQRARKSAPERMRSVSSCVEMRVIDGQISSCSA